ncbi:hypothetical protein K250101E9_08050 [Enterocloster aldenensis]
MRPIYYAVYDYENYLGQYTSAQVQDIMGINRSIPSHYSDNGKPYKGRYMFKRIDAEPSPWEIEWDRVTAWFRNSMYDLSRIAIVAGGDTDGQGHIKTVHRCLRDSQRDRRGNPED